jgi:hypothetical protein
MVKLPVVVKVPPILDAPFKATSSLTDKLPPTLSVEPLKKEKEPFIVKLPFTFNVPPKVKLLPQIRSC